MKHYKGKDIKEEYFNLAMYDLEEGMSITDLRKLLEEYSAQELYWECAGIQKAIDHMSFMLLTLMSDKLNKQEINLNYANTKEETTRE
jgi:short-subunit dehydrogenase involved in D-alanine esterification of teichoic acids